MTTKAKYRNGIFTGFDSTTHESFPWGAPTQLYDDFIGPLFTTTNEGPWVLKDTQTAGNATEAVVANAPNGIFRLHLDGAQNEKQEAGLYMNDSLHFNIDKGLVIEVRAAVHIAPTGQSELYFGLANAYVEGPIAEADAGPTIHAFFMFDGGLVCTLHSDDTSHDVNATATGITVVADVFHIFRIDMTTPADTLFYIDGARVGSGTTHDMSNGTNVVVQPFFMAHKETSTGVGDLDIDYVKIWQASR